VNSISHPPEFVNPAEYPVQSYKSLTKGPAGKPLFHTFVPFISKRTDVLPGKFGPADTDKYQYRFFAKTYESAVNPGI
jgi:hypothetical protein